MLSGNGYVEIQSTGSSEKIGITLEARETSIEKIGITLIDTKGFSLVDFNPESLLSLLGYGTYSDKDGGKKMLPVHHALFFVTVEAVIQLPAAWKNLIRYVTNVFEDPKSIVRYNFVISQMDKISRDLIIDPNVGLKNPLSTVAQNINNIRSNFASSIKIGVDKVAYTVNYFESNIIPNKINFEIERRAYILLREAMVNANAAVDANLNCNIGDGLLS